MGQSGYDSFFEGVGTLAVRVEDVEPADRVLDWHNIGLARDHSGYVQDGEYRPADTAFEDGFVGTNFVVVQRGCNGCPSVWHLHPDLVCTLSLLREGDRWLAIEEGFCEVVRMQVSASGSPLKLEIRADFLKDYLCARRMALRVSTYVEKHVVVSDISPLDLSLFDGDEEPRSQQESESSLVTRNWHKSLGDGKWQASVQPIHEGGHPFGSGFAVMWVGRKEFDKDQSVPEMQLSDEMEHSTREGTFAGSLLYRVRGELWRDQWVHPAQISVRVRGDEPPPTCFFTIDSEGNRVSGDSLKSGMRWLWFSPGIVEQCLSYRGATLSWYTRETGRITMAEDSGVVFGVNASGLINIFAKDIAYLRFWQQKVWTGFNVLPEGGVSAELLASQAEGLPASTKAPENFILKARAAVDDAFLSKFGCKVFRDHPEIKRIAIACHRFRATDQTGLMGLAKDLARLSADDIDVKVLHKLLQSEPAEKSGSLKSLQKVLAGFLGDDIAKNYLSPLFAIYDLRLTDAHLPSNQQGDFSALLGLDPSLPFVAQGRNLLNAFVNSLYRIAMVVSKGHE